MTKPKHIAFAPARKGSVGFPGKNRLFFDTAADFMQSAGLFNEVIVSTDDEVLEEKATQRKFLIHRRNAYLSGGDISIKQVAENMAAEMKLNPGDYVWLIYVNVLYRNAEDFRKTMRLVEKENISSLCSFIKPKVHPFDCWKFDEKEKVLTQFVPNDACRRQDKPPAWQHYHYLTCFQPKALPLLNQELLSAKTYPLFLDETTTNNLVEVDTPQEYEEWRNKNEGQKVFDC